MKTLNILVLFCGLSLLLISCEKGSEEGTKEIAGAEYLPLALGNYWLLESDQKREIIGETQIENKSYYKLAYYNDTSFYRIEGKKIIVKERGGKAAVKFDFSAKLNDTWNYNEWKVKLVSTTESVPLGNTMIKNAYKFTFDDPAWADEEYSITLAPGIGIVATTCECVIWFKRLRKASVNNVETTYW